VTNNVVSSPIPSFPSASALGTSANPAAVSSTNEVFSNQNLEKVNLVLLFLSIPSLNVSLFFSQTKVNENSFPSLSSSLKNEADEKKFISGGEDLRCPSFETVEEGQYPPSTGIEVTDFDEPNPYPSSPTLPTTLLHYQEEIHQKQEQFHLLEEEFLQFKLTTKQEKNDYLLDISQLTMKLKSEEYARELLTDLTLKTDRELAKTLATTRESLTHYQQLCEKLTVERQIVTEDVSYYQKLVQKYKKDLEEERMTLLETTNVMIDNKMQKFVLQEENETLLQEFIAFKVAYGDLLMDLETEKLKNRNLQQKLNLYAEKMTLLEVKYIQQKQSQQQPALFNALGKESNLIVDDEAGNGWKPLEEEEEKHDGLVVSHSKGTLSALASETENETEAKLPDSTIVSLSSVTSSASKLSLLQPLSAIMGGGAGSSSLLSFPSSPSVSSSFSLSFLQSSKN
jgi:hypothetical protein